MGECQDSWGQYSRCKLIVKGGGEVRSPPSAYTSLRSEGAVSRHPLASPPHRYVRFALLLGRVLPWRARGLVLRSPLPAYTSLRSEGTVSRHPLASPPHWYVRFALLRGGDLPWRVKGLEKIIFLEKKFCCVIIWDSRCGIMGEMMVFGGGRRNGYGGN